MANGKPASFLPGRLLALAAAAAARVHRREEKNTRSSSGWTAANLIGQCVCDVMCDVATCCAVAARLETGLLNGLSRVRRPAVESVANLNSLAALELCDCDAASSREARDRSSRRRRRRISADGLQVAR